MALHLSMQQHRGGEHDGPPYVAAHAQPPQPDANGTAARPAGGDGSWDGFDALPPAGGESVHGVQVRVVGSESVAVGRSTFVGYRLHVLSGGRTAEPTVALQRFSAFVELIPKLAKELGPHPSDELASALEGWKRQLAVEKRHTGARSRGDAVVNARCQLLQQMLDSLMRFPEVGGSVQMAIFLSADVSAAAA